MTVHDVLSSLREAGDRVRGFWLDGAGGRSWSGRRSILGLLEEGDPSLVFDAHRGVVERHCDGVVEEVGTDIFDALEREMAALAGSIEMWVGYFGYASRTDLPARASINGVPDAVWMGCRAPVVVDEPTVPESRTGRGDHTSDVPADVPTLEEYEHWFDTVQHHLRAGDTYELNLTYRTSRLSTCDPMTTYLRLRKFNPAPYAGLLTHRGTTLLAASPERFAKVDEDRWLETKPIKGTTSRGRNTAEDAAARWDLATDARFRAENLMILDLLRNDLATVCAVGSVTVPELMQVESYEHVHQLVSTVRGRLRPEVSTVASIRAIFPPGSMTGAPKRRTMELIDSIEPTARGIYSGAFGWIGTDGTADLGVVIRSAVATSAPGGHTYEIGCGGGVTVWSDARAEYDETMWKLSSVVGAIAERGEVAGPGAVRP
ncbi:hypothetical protein ASC77_18765 [Nocardioides sp. Root1257]|uniref:anthranilate synthase component I family protein n=1 Tax=unclassified Nocardioides TaxID=2615069 RepID=UPI0006FF2D5D|nr:MULTISPECIES: anthranilate synthase component I family protein [unclassified Nocardioides]KQW45953.1 hypothetical protein ASC77_18765 [Nocardioides sp. Root1257]KRC43217.1 hypothetical protein ASE24_19730 [Nocardioides sp. Root224]